MYILWLIVVIGHLALIVGNTVAVVFVAIHAPWYILTLCITFYASPALGGFYCVLTNVENYLRFKLNWEMIPDDFLSFYIRKILNKKV